MSIGNPEERRFYEIGAQQNRWSLSELKRQFITGLSASALSRDRSCVVAPRLLSVFIRILLPGSRLILYPWK